MSTPLPSTTFSRRQVLKIGLLGTLTLSAAGTTAMLTGCSASTPANGFQVLRSTDMPLLQRLIPVILDGAVPAGQIPLVQEQALRQLDMLLAHFSLETLKLIRQLFDILLMPISRGPLTGVWGRWETASDPSVQRFLERWQNSAIPLLRQGHAALSQLISMAWYSQPDAWRHCGYPGPPRL